MDIILARLDEQDQQAEAAELDGAVSTMTEKEFEMWLQMIETRPGCAARLVSDYD